MKRHLEITKIINQQWTDNSVSKIKDYWSGRGFDFAEGGNTCLSAKRGCILWNLITYNMARLGTELTICQEESSRISVTMKVCTLWQIITEWNRKYFDLEMETCESFLRSGDLRKSEWASFTKGHRKANFLWTVTLGICGQSPPTPDGPQ